MLSRQKQSLDAELEGLKAQQADLQKTMDDLNGIVADIGSIASNHNSQVMSYKNTCKELTGNFASGRYGEDHVQGKHNHFSIQRP